MNTVAFLTIPAGIVPEQAAVVFDGQRFTYAEVEARVRRLAGALARLGVGRGTRVAALDTNSHRYLESYYATALLVGGRYVSAVEALRPGLPALRTVIAFDGPHGDLPDFEALLAEGEPV